MNEKEQKPASREEPKCDVEERERRWLDENRAAFDALTRFHEQYGIFNEADREW